MQVKVIRGKKGAEGVRVQVGTYEEKRTNENGIAIIKVGDTATRHVFINGKDMGEFVTPDNLEFTI